MAFIVWLCAPVSFSQQTVFIPTKVASKKTITLDSSAWKSTGMFILNINQSAQSDWGSGGEDFMIGVNGIINKTIHHSKHKYSFDLYTDIELGFVQATSFKKIRKTTDRVDITGEIEHRIGTKGHYNYALLGNINTQLFDGHSFFLPDYPKNSSFLSPGKFLLSLGIDYKHITENRYFSFFISPITARWVTKTDDDFYNVKKYGVDSLHRVNTEIGAYLSVHLNCNFSKTTQLSSRLDLFSNYKRKPQNIDILFNNILTFNIARSFAFTLLFDIVYDHDFKKRTQIQEISGLGVRLKL
jgi:hypothetical protein